MKTKKIISLKRYNKQKHNWEKKLFQNKELTVLKNKTFLKAYKLRISYLNSWMNEPILQTSDDIMALQEIIFKDSSKYLIIGIGINISNKPLIKGYKTTFLENHSIKKINKIQVVNKLKLEFEKIYERKYK